MTEWRKAPCFFTDKHHEHSFAPGAPVFCIIAEKSCALRHSAHGWIFRLTIVLPVAFSLGFGAALPIDLA
jgi:hypothetical protein